MAYTPPPAGAHDPDNRFQIDLAGDGSDVYDVPKANFMNIEQAEKVNFDQDALIEFFAAGDPGRTEVLRSLEQQQFEAIVKAWRKDSGLDAEGGMQASSS